MIEWGPIVLAIVAVVSLGVQGLMKTLHVLAERRAKTMRPPPIPDMRAPFDSQNYGRPAMHEDLPQDFPRRFRELEIEVRDLRKILERLNDGR